MRMSQVRWLMNEPIDEAAVLVRSTRLIDENGDLYHGDVLLHNDGSWTPGLGNEDARSVVDGKERLITRSLQNWHTHAAMLLNARDFSDGLPLDEWLNQVVFPTEQRLSEELVRVGTRAAAAEMIQTGTTFCADMYYHPQASAETLSQAGIRALVASPISEPPVPSYPGGSSEALEVGKRLFDDDPPERTEFALGPHSIYLCEMETLDEVAGLAEDVGSAVHIHMAETRREVAACHEQHGGPPVSILEGREFFRNPTICAHSSWLRKDEIGILAKRDVKAVHCPTSNAKLACGGTLSMPAHLDAGTDVRLGTDGSASSGQGLDLRQEARFASLIQRHDHWDATLMPASDTWALATKGSRDWVSWNLDDIRMRPYGRNGRRLLGHLVYSNTECLDVWVDGLAVRRDGVTLTVDDGHAADEVDRLVDDYYDGLGPE